MGKRRKKSTKSIFSFLYVFLGVFAIFITVGAINYRQTILQFAQEIGELGKIAEVTERADDIRDVWPAVARDSAGVGHVVVDRKIVELDEEGYETLLGRYPIYSKGRGTTFLPEPIKLDDTCDGSVGCQPAIAISSKGKVMAVWTLSPSDGVGYQTWQSTNLPSGAAKRLGSAFGVGYQLNIAADNKENFHIVGNGDFKVKYCIWNGSRCTYYTEIEGKGSANPEVAIDSQGNSYVLWLGPPGQTVHLAEHKAGSSTITTRELGKGINPQMATDEEDNVHIVWSQDWNIRYCRLQFGKECDQTYTHNDGQAIQPSIGVTDQGNVLIAFSRQKAKLFYLVLSEDEWIGPSELSSGGIHNDVSPNSEKSKLSAVWGSEDRILYTEIDVGALIPPPPPPPCKTLDDTGKCVEKDSSIGILSTLPPGFIGRLLEIALGFVGGILVLLIMYSGYTFLTSQGSSEQVKKAQDIFKAAIFGLLFVVFAFIILEVIVVDLLKLPGFTR